MCKRTIGEFVCKRTIREFVCTSKKHQQGRCAHPRAPSPASDKSGESVYAQDQSDKCSATSGNITIIDNDKQKSCP